MAFRFQIHVLTIIFCHEIFSMKKLSTHDYCNSKFKDLFLWLHYIVTTATKKKINRRKSRHNRSEMLLHSDISSGPNKHAISEREREKINDLYSKMILFSVLIQNEI